MQILQRARSHRRGHANARIVSKHELVSAVSYDGPRCLQHVRQVVVGELDLVAEDHPSVVEPVGNRAGAHVRVEQTGVEHDELDERRKAELPRFEDKVAFVQAT